MKISKKVMAEIIKAAEGIMERGMEAMGEQREKRIPCPIKMEWSPLNGGDGLGIPFPDGKRSLWYHDALGDYLVGMFNRGTLVPCVLIPCKREDLKEGDTAVHTSLDTPRVNDLRFYCKIKKNNRYAFINKGSALDSDMPWENWYKVVQA